MKLNDIWSIYNQLIQSSETTDTTRKMSALNIAQRYLIERSLELGKKIDEFRTDPTNVANTIELNYIPTPDDFLALEKAWYRAGTQFIPFGRSAYITYDDLLNRIGQQFFMEDLNASPLLVAVKEPNIYFDQYFNNEFTADEIITGTTSGATATITTVTSTTVLTIAVTAGTFSADEVITGTTSGTTATITTVDSTTQLTIVRTGGTKDIKISYIKYPDDIVYYDTLTMDSVSGAFTVGETIEGTDSNATGEVRTVTATSLTITNRDGTFQDDEVITGGTSSATADVNGDVDELSDTLEWTAKYRYIVAEAAALIWRHMKGSNSVAASSDIVDGLIEMMSVLSRGEEETTWSVE